MRQCCVSEDVHLTPFTHTPKISVTFSLKRSIVNKSHSNDGILNNMLHDWRCRFKNHYS